MSASGVRDFDFRPDEDEVRLFETGPAGVLRLSGDAYVSAGDDLPDGLLQVAATICGNRGTVGCYPSRPI